MLSVTLCYMQHYVTCRCSHTLEHKQAQQERKRNRLKASISISSPSSPSHHGNTDNIVGVGLRTRGADSSSSGFADSDRYGMAGTTFLGKFIHIIIIDFQYGFLQMTNWQVPWELFI